MWAHGRTSREARRKPHLQHTGDELTETSVHESVGNDHGEESLQERERSVEKFRMGGKGEALRDVRGQRYMSVADSVSKSHKASEQSVGRQQRFPVYNCSHRKSNP